MDFCFNKMDMVSFFVINKKEKVVVSGWIHFLCVSNKRMDFGSNFHFLYIFHFPIPICVQQTKNIFTLKFQKFVFSMQEGISH